VSTTSGRARGDDEELARGRGFRPPEDRCSDEALASVRVRCGDRSDSTTLIVLMETWTAPLPRAPDQAVVAEHDAFDGAVVRPACTASVARVSPASVCRDNSCAPASA
jgi:hypothetical protein